MSTLPCLVEQHGHVLVVTLNRPARRNAITGEMMALMVDAWDRVDQDPEIRCAVITGAAGHFCGGADLKRMNESSPDQRFESGQFDPTTMPALLKGRRLTKPLVAAVEGSCIAGGVEILMGTDLRVAGRGAKFGLSEARWGLFPLGGSAVRLPRQIPYTMAADLALTARHITAEEAFSFGLVGHLVDEGKALERAMELAEQIAGNGPLAVQAILETMRATEGLQENDAFRVETPIGMKVFTSDDAKEGPRAFAEKRAPRFRGR